MNIVKLKEKKGMVVIFFLSRVIFSLVYYYFLKDIFLFKEKVIFIDYNEYKVDCSIFI